MHDNLSTGLSRIFVSQVEYLLFQASISLDYQATISICMSPWQWVGRCRASRISIRVDLGLWERITLVRKFCLLYAQCFIALYRLRFLRHWWCLKRRTKKRPRSGGRLGAPELWEWLGKHSPGEARTGPERSSADKIDISMPWLWITISSPFILFKQLWMLCNWLKRVDG